MDKTGAPLELFRNALPIHFNLVASFPSSSDSLGTTSPSVVFEKFNSFLLGTCAVCSFFTFSLKTLEMKELRAS